MATVEYSYLRALELEGRHPEDVGTWYSTHLRLMVGEGSPLPDSSWHDVEFPDDGVFPATSPSPDNPRIGIRVFCYRRVRTSDECDRAGRVLGAVVFSTQLTAGWATPADGLVDLPRRDEPVLGPTHSVCIVGSDGARRLFRFPNSWGEKWGLGGYGYIPFEYFDRYVFEAWALYPRPDSLRVFRRWDAGGPHHSRWSGLDEGDHRLYGFDVHDERARERHAWAFVVERDGALEVEELYVRPEFRRQGHGGWLAAQVVELARVKGLPLRAWAHFADSHRESPANYDGLVAVARRLEVQFQPCPVRWAAYFATNEKPGRVLPVEPDFIPQRPRSTLGDVLKLAAVAGGLSVGTNGTPAAPGSPGPVEVAEPPVEVGTPEWDRLTRRRAELIYKKNRAGLTPEEQTELAVLQELDRAAIARRFPRPTLSPAERAILDRAVEAAGGATGQ